MSNPNDVFLIDMDGFLFDLHRKVAARLSGITNGYGGFFPEVSVADCTNNSPAKGFEHIHPSARRLVKAMLAEPGFYRDLEPLPDAVWGVEKIREMGLRPVVLSSLGDAPACAADKVASLDQHFRGLIHPRDYNFTSCKDLVDGAFFGDDGREYLQTWKKNHPRGLTFTLARPYTKLGDADFFAAHWRSLIALLRAELPLLGRII